MGVGVAVGPGVLVGGGAVCVNCEVGFGPAPGVGVISLSQAVRDSTSRRNRKRGGRKRFRCAARRGGFIKGNTGKRCGGWEWLYRGGSHSLYSRGAVAFQDTRVIIVSYGTSPGTGRTDAS